MKLKAKTQEKKGSCSVPEHEFQDTRRRKLCTLILLIFTIVCVLASIVLVIYTVQLDFCHNDAVPEKKGSCSVPEHEFQDTRRRKLCTLILLIFTIVCVLASIVLVIYTVQLDFCHNDAVPATGSGYSKSEGGPRIIRRKEWLTSPAIHPVNPLHHPVPYVIISHTGTENCSMPNECVEMVRQIQTFHMDSIGWWDIGYGYNFLVGGDNLVYEDRGWDSPGGFAYGYINQSIGIAFIGSFHTHLPTPAQMSAAKRLIELGVEIGRVAQDYKLLGHRQVSRTSSPGDRFFEELQTWPHWAEVS